MKKEFNASQRGLPNIIRFSKLNIDDKDKNEDIFFFHIIFRRELDGAYKVKEKYDFLKVSGLKEVDLSYKTENNFFTDDILLFELKDSTIENVALNCLRHNYKVLNGHIKNLKKIPKYKNCKFFYIGIQERKKKEEENKEKDENKKGYVEKNGENLFVNNNNNFSLDLLNIKYYTFFDGKIFGENYRKVNPKKLEILKFIKRKT